MTVALIILYVVLIYAAVGLAFGLVFVAVGVATVDHAAKKSSWSFRALIFPGAAALWPLMLAKWVLATRTRQEENKS